MARPAKVWYRSALDTWFVTHQGKKTSLHVKGREHEAAAWRAWDRLLTEQGASPPAPTPSPQPVTVRRIVNVREVVDVFLKDSEDRVQPETHELYRLFLNNFAAKYGDTLTDDLTSVQVEAYSRKPEWSDSTRSAFMAVLLRAFRHAVRAKIIEKVPIPDLKRPPIARRGQEVLVTEEEHKKLCDVAPAPFRLFLQLMWLTGARPSELSRLTAADIDWQVGVATLAKHKTAHKGKRRTIYLPPAALTLLAPLIAQYASGPLLRNRIGQRWTKATLGMAMRKARKEAGLKKKILYGIRHSWITDALEKGVPDAIVAALAGHHNTDMIHRYYNHLGRQTKVLTEAVKMIR
jgi:integrase